MSPSVTARMSELVLQGAAEGREYGLLLFGRKGRVTDCVEVPPGDGGSVELKSRAQEGIVREWVGRGFEFVGDFNNHPGNAAVSEGRPLEARDLWPSLGDRRAYYVVHARDEVVGDGLLSQRIREARWDLDVQPLDFIGGLVEGRVVLAAFEMKPYGKGTLYTAKPRPIKLS